MKKVIAYVASRNINSATLRNTKIILNQLESSFPSLFSIEVITPHDLAVHPSNGCKTCYEEGYCPIDELGIDKGAEFKTKLLEADFIILSSPVYSHNVSADMKAVIERLSYWGHIFKLAGKSGIVLATADSNGVHHVSDYLEKIAHIMGLNVIDKLNITTRAPLKEHYLEELVQEIYEYAYGLKEIEVDERAERSFQTYKKTYIQLPTTLAEPKYWKENGLFNHESLQSYIDEILVKQRDKDQKQI